MMSKKHVLIDFFETKAISSGFDALSVLSNDASAITYSLSGLKNDKLDIDSFSNKIKAKFDENIVEDEFGLRFSRLMEKYMIHYEVDFFDDSFSVKIFSTGSILDSKEDIEVLYINMLEDMLSINHFAKK